MTFALPDFIGFLFLYPLPFSIPSFLSFMYVLLNPSLWMMVFHHPSVERKNTEIPIGFLIYSLGCFFSGKHVSYDLEAAITLTYKGVERKVAS